MTDQVKYKTDCYVFLLAKAYQKGQQLVQKRLKPYGLTNVQYLVLEVLWSERGLTAAEIGHRLSMDKATLSWILDRRTESEFIGKEQDEQDRRMIRLYPSEDLNRIKDQVIDQRKQANDELLTGFTVEERVLLRRLLLEMI
ncbi:MAG: MarR family transcriptional regulator [Proteobacteria bacterium]|nr:MarR family transcriptional regulator [Pseudomonadota bacterium]